MVGHNRGLAAVLGYGSVQHGQRVGRGGLVKDAVDRQAVRGVVLVPDEPPPVGQLLKVSMPPC